MSVFATNSIVLAFLAVLVVWLFARKGEKADRAFLAAAGVIYIAVMMGTIWKFGTTDDGHLKGLGYAVLETCGLILVMLSRRIRKPN